MITYSEFFLKMPTKVYTESNTILSNYVSIADDNEFIPIHSLSSGYKISVRDRKTYIYKLDVNLTALVNRRISIFCSYLITNYDNWVQLSISTLTRKYYGIGGMIVYLEGDSIYNYIAYPLMLLAVKRKYLFKISKENPNPNMLCLVIDNSFINDLEHYKLFRNVEKNYINIISNHIDVYYTNDIKRICYNRTIDTPKFNTISEMMEHCNSMNNTLQEGLKVLV